MDTKRLPSKSFAARLGASCGLLKVVPNRRRVKELGKDMSRNYILKQGGILSKNKYLKIQVYLEEKYNIDHFKHKASSCKIRSTTKIRSMLMFVQNRI